MLYTDRILPIAKRGAHLKWIHFILPGIDFAAGSPLLAKPRPANHQPERGRGAADWPNNILMMLLAQGHRLPVAIANQQRAEWPRERWEIFRRA